MWTTAPAIQLAAAFLLGIISTASVSAQGRVTQVRSVVNGTARLPCDLTPPSHNDSVILVIWFKNEKTAIYSFDARQRLSSPAASHWKHPQLVADRGLFSTLESPAELSLSRLQEGDDAVYRCRVDFRRSASRNSRVRLSVVVPPQRPEIFDERGVRLGAVAGPYEEGGNARLTCIVSGGRPEPSVRWWRGERLLESRELPAGTRIRKRLLLVPRLSRGDLHAVFTCQASNSNITVPTEARVALDVHFRPLSTNILLEEQPLSAGRRYHVACQSVGSRPPAAVSWWLDNTRLLTSNDQVSADSNETMSTLSLTPSQGDDGRLLTCRAENPHVRAGTQEHSVKLAVYYAPTSELRLGQRMRPDDIQEGSDVYFECRVRANPPAYKVTWKFQGQTLVQNASGGVIVTDEALALQSVGRENAGAYSCVASNVEGDGESSPLQLRVKYKPVCAGGQQRVLAVSPHESALVRCRVEARPSARGFRWAFNSSVETLPLPLPPARFNWSADASQLVYRPAADADYGSLLCWAHNAVGQQREPCVFHVVPAGRPDAPSNCSLVNQTSESVWVQCAAGFDGGQPQTFLLEVLDAATGLLLYNATQPLPNFLVDGLPAGQLLLLRVSAFSVKGRSEAFLMEFATLLPAEVRADEVTVHLEMSGALWAALAAVALLLVVAAVAAVWAATVRGRQRRRARGGASPARLALKKKAAAAAAAAAAADNSDKDDRNPDVVPSLSGDWSEPEAASSPRATPVAPDPEPPPHPLQAAGVPTTQVFSVCSATAGPYVPHPATLRRPTRTCRRQADGQGQPEVTYAELRLPLSEAAPLTLPRQRHEPVIYAQIDHAPASTSALCSRSPPVARSLQRTVSPPHSLPLLANMQTEVVTVRTPLMSGQQESCV